MRWKRTTEARRAPTGGTGSRGAAGRQRRGARLLILMLAGPTGCGGGVPTPVAPESAPLASTRHAAVQPADAPADFAAGAASMPGIVFEAVPPGVPARLASAAADDRLEAVEALAGVDDPEAIQALSLALFDDDPYVRESAVDSLAEIGSEQAVLALVPMLSAQDPDLREHVVDALAECRSPAALSLLQQALADDSPAVREAAADYLAER